MKIWIDADACPGEIKNIVFRASERLSVPICLVANRSLGHPRSPYISVVQVGMGLDVADDYIAQEALPGDLVVTADIPLAAKLVEKRVAALNPRGEFYTEENVRERLSVRNFMQGIRDAGGFTGGPPKFDGRAKQLFAAALDKFLSVWQRTKAKE